MIKLICYSGSKSTRLFKENMYQNVLSHFREFKKKEALQKGLNTYQMIILRNLFYCSSVVCYFAETIDLFCALSENCQDLSFLHGAMLCCTCTTVCCQYRWELETLLLCCQKHLSFTHLIYRHLATRSHSTLWSMRATNCILLSEKGWIHAVSENISISLKLRHLVGHRTWSLELPKVSVGKWTAGDLTRLI